MARENDDPNAIRRYLLKQLSASGQKTVELRMLSDDAVSEEVDFVEDELIDECLAGELPANERKSFEETFLAHPGRQRKLQTAQAFKRHFGHESPSPPP